MIQPTTMCNRGHERGRPHPAYSTWMQTVPGATQSRFHTAHFDVLPMATGCGSLTFVGRMKRRKLIAEIAGTAVWPLAARAQQKAHPVIGYLNNGFPLPAVPNVAAFRQGLSASGFVEGQNVTIEYRWAEGHIDRLPALAADLVSRKVDVIASIGTQATQAAKGASQAIPIVFLLGDDPVSYGLVASLARPGGNATGTSILAVDLNPKRLELLKELLPRAGIIALLVDPRNVNKPQVMQEIEEAARVKWVQLHVLKASSDSEIDAAFDSLSQRQVEALFVDVDGYFVGRRETDRRFGGTPSHSSDLCIP